MERRFTKLPRGTLIDDLKISKRNRVFIDKLLLDLKGHVCPERLGKYKYATTRFAHLVGKDFDKMIYEDIRQAGGLINQSPFSTKTKQDVISEVRAAFKFWFGDNEHYPKVVSGLKAPQSKMRLRLPQDMPTEDDIYRIIKATGNSRDAFLIAFMGLDGGVRPIEMRRMKWGDIKKDKYSHFVVIHTAKRSGDKDTRVIRILKSEPYFIRWTHDYPAERNDNAFVFINLADLKQMSVGTMSSLFVRMKKKLGLKELYPYLLRHQWITRASKDPRWPLPVLKKFIGHSLRSNTIAEYQHFGDDDLKEAQLRINGIVTSENTEEKWNRKPSSCPKCGNANEYDAEFCWSCSTSLSQRREIQAKDLFEESNHHIYEQIKEKLPDMIADILKNQKGSSET